MKTISRIMMAGSMLALAGCGSLPESGFGPTFLAGPFLRESISGTDFNAALAREYQNQTNLGATRDVNWYDASAYAVKGYAAMKGEAVAPWKPADLGVSGEAVGLYDKVVAAINGNKAKKPAECAKLQALWDSYLEELSEGAHSCSDPAKMKANMMAALDACGAAAAATPPKAADPVKAPRSDRFTVYFGFNRSDLSAQARDVINNVLSALKGYTNPAISLVGHTDTVGNKAYNQRLSEARVATVANALRAGAPDKTKNMTTAGRSEFELAVPTKDNVKEQGNRRVEIVITE